MPYARQEHVQKRMLARSVWSLGEALLAIGICHLWNQETSPVITALNHLAREITEYPGTPPDAILRGWAAELCSFAGSGNCTWTPSDELWQTECGHAWMFVAGGVLDNKVRFCMYCGLPVRALM